MKRERDALDRSIAMANCLILLSRGGQFDHQPLITTASHDDVDDSYHHHRRVFECKTCNRQFPSFQALGGHRASHKKPRPAVATAGGVLHHDGKPKTHECSICGAEFAIGQALGGHMRRHRSAAPTLNDNKKATLSCSSDGSCLDSDNQIRSSCEGKEKRVLLLDLNLTPSENDLEFVNYV